MNVCCLRHKGWPFLTLTYVSPKAISFVAAQIGVSAGCISRYGESRNTKFNHILEICESYGYRQETAWEELGIYVETLSSRLRDETAALKEIVTYAVANHIILPRITTLEKMVNDMMNRMDAAIFARISSSLSEEQKNRLGSVLTSEGNGLSELLYISFGSGSLTWLEQIGRFSVKSAELAEKNLLVQSGFHLVLEDGVLRPGFSLLESGYDVDVHIRLFVEIKAVAQSELLELCLLAVGLLLGC